MIGLYVEQESNTNTVNAVKLTYVIDGVSTTVYLVECGVDYYRHISDSTWTIDSGLELSDGSEFIIITSLNGSWTMVGYDSVTTELITIQNECIKVTFDSASYSIQKTGIVNGKNEYFLLETIDIVFDDSIWNLTLPDAIYTIPTTPDIPISYAWEYQSGTEYTTVTTSIPSSYKRVDLFQDEQINITSSVQNINDISRTFSDFSQSFTVPASQQNNNIFEYFYQSQLDSETNHNVNKNAYIEIDTALFRKGKISIERANIVSNRVESYMLTFYGNLRSLQDILGADKLNTLTEIPNTAYTPENILDRITLTSDYDTRFPLIANRLWNYGDADANDISTNTGAINYRELFPALRIRKIFEAIENKYGITFDTLLYDDPRFKQCFLYLNNGATLTQSLVGNDLGFFSYNYIAGNVDLTDFVTTNTFNITTTLLETTQSVTFHFSIDSITTPSTTTFDVYKDGILYQSVTKLYANSGDTIDMVILSPEIGAYTFKIRAEIDTLIESSVIVEAENAWAIINSTMEIVFTDTSASPLLNISALMPDMKIVDFIKGVINQFNIACVGTNQTNFTFIPLESWYNKGRVREITQYVVNSNDVNRIKLFNSIKFSGQQSESFMNKKFNGLFGREYGSATQTYNYDGSQFTIELPFETLLFNKFTDTNIQVAYTLNESFNTYIPKPTLLYFYEVADISATPIKYYNGTTYDTINNYAVFGQDVQFLNTDYSLNFGADVSSYLLNPIPNGIYRTYYSAYLENMYYSKNRMYNIQTRLPLSLLTDIQLNDRLVIRDKRFIINEMKTNLNTQEVSFQLVQDFRSLTSPTYITATQNEECLSVPFYLPNDAVLIELSTTSAGVTFTPDMITASQWVSICLDAYVADYLITEDGDYLLTESGDFIVTDESSDSVITISVLTTYNNGDTETREIIITR